MTEAGLNGGVNDEEHFQVDRATGIVRVVRPLDYESSREHVLTVFASDGIHEAKAALVVSVEDANDNAPVWEETVYSFDVREDTPAGTIVGVVRAHDVDTGNGNGRVSYIMNSVWEKFTFAIDQNSGTIKLIQPLDHERVGHFILEILAIDDGQPTQVTSVTAYVNVVDVNDNPPIFSPVSYRVEVDEGLKEGTEIVAVVATDEDDGLNGKIKYQILEGNSDGLFELNETTGVITTALSSPSPSSSSLFSAKLDRELREYYILDIIAVDAAAESNNRLTSTAQVTVILQDVNDNAPEFASPSVAQVPENVEAGYLVMTVSAEDPDLGANGHVTYELMGHGQPDDDNNENNNNNNDDGAFTIHPTNGELRVNSKLDAEKQKRHFLRIKASDNGNPHPLETLVNITINVIDVNDNSPVFEESEYSKFIPENVAVGHDILTVSASDADLGFNGLVRYFLSDGEGRHDFSLDRDSGLLRVVNPLDYETRSRYSLTVLAVDSAASVSASSSTSSASSKTATATVKVVVTDVNDAAPEFLHSPFRAFVLENVPEANLPMKALKVEAIDADSPIDSIRYSLKESREDAFVIDAESGVISVIKPLDYETQKTITLIVMAKDDGNPALTGSGTINILVVDGNDHPPRFVDELLLRQQDVGEGHRVVVDEDVEVGSVVARLPATDEDVGDNGKLVYSLRVLGGGGGGGDADASASAFAIDEKTGDVRTTRKLDREKQDSFVLEVVVRDSGIVESLVTTAAMTIVVDDADDNVPAFLVVNGRREVHVMKRLPAGR